MIELSKVCEASNINCETWVTGMFVLQQLNIWRVFFYYYFMKMEKKWWCLSHGRSQGLWCSNPAAPGVSETKPFIGGGHRRTWSGSCCAKFIEFSPSKILPFQVSKMIVHGFVNPVTLFSLVFCLSVWIGLDVMFVEDLRSISDWSLRLFSGVIEQPCGSEGPRS